MPYATQTDIEARYPGELAQAGPREADGALDAAAIAQILADVSDLADGYLRAAPAGYAVPWPDPVPAWLVEAVVGMALYLATPTAVASQEDFKDRRRRYDDALALLEGIAAGRVLPPPAASAAASLADGLYIASNPRLFGRGAL